MKIMTHRWRSVHGVLLLDKALGYSSHQAVQKVKYLYRANRAGHTGTLDPLATGMLPICFGEATKFSQYILNSDKEYHVIARLGQRTNTSDAGGILLSTRLVKFSIKKLEAVLESFRGEIQQIPSMYSAIKYQGRKMYEYAREGVHVPRESRRVVVYTLRCIRYEGNELELEMRVSKGTYVRTIVDDLGEKLGCGAHVICLRRLQVSDYPREKMITLESLLALANQEKDLGVMPYTYIDSLLMPIDSPVSGYPSVNLQNMFAKYFKQGRPLRLAGGSVSGLVRVTEGEDSKFIGIAEVTDNGLLKPKRVVI
ncbi:tRNA pseudouridine(55) synthase TruB [Candidatus Erwinia haradaeae]|uniref:tRNA pseudouridine synthase B n=1 Tax=Candidatus Erwinia haradaeae TaxID=1922217 RepID=A0A451DAD1_9GAMM|nr:tRNA pseudouridine(55) synthase TruB [Candidatus Erwinia haradaeae]VFP83276.1 tRNA pseudouridine synthase B [Candidatus Erwinia haradaeae]